MYGSRPSEILDPAGNTLAGMDRMMFDIVLSGAVLEEEKIARGETDGISTEARVRYEHKHLDLAEHDEIDRMRDELRKKKEAKQCQQPKSMSG
jgi:hypothetical protein